MSTKNAKHKRLLNLLCIVYKGIIINLGDKTILYLIFNRFNGFVGVQNRKAEQPV